MCLIFIILNPIITTLTWCLYISSLKKSKRKWAMKSANEKIENK